MYQMFGGVDREREREMSVLDLIQVSHITHSVNLIESR